VNRKEVKVVLNPSTESVLGAAVALIEERALKDPPALPADADETRHRRTINPRLKQTVIAQEMQPLEG
jgi:hypothetical protein